MFVIGPLASEAGDTSSPVLPSVEAVLLAENSVTKQEITCRVPSIQAQIRQSTIEGLQFFADDLTHWLDGAFGDGSRPKPRDELKMIGSRFFGSKGSSSASSSILDQEEDVQSASVFRVIVSEFDARFHVPRGARSSPTSGERILSLRASDVDTKVEINSAPGQGMTFTLAIMDTDFSDRSHTTPTRIFGRTTPPTFAQRTPPLIHLHFYTLTDPYTDAKESGVKLATSTGVFFIEDDLQWAKDLALFAKTPEGVFEDVVPSEITCINVTLSEMSIHVKAPKEKGAMVLVLGTVGVMTDLISRAEESILEVGAARCGILAVDDLVATTGLQPGYASALDAWRVSYLRV